MTAPQLPRRTVVKAAAWAVPVIAMAVSTPLAAASVAPVEQRNRLRFSNVTARVGAEANAIYFNTTVIVNDGPDQADQVMLSVSLSRDGETVTRTWPLIAGWGNGGNVELVWRGIPKGAPVVVTATAWALNVATISGSDTVETPSWWA